MQMSVRATGRGLFITRAKVPTPHTAHRTAALVQAVPSVSAYAEIQLLGTIVWASAQHARSAGTDGDPVATPLSCHPGVLCCSATVTLDRALLSSGSILTSFDLEWEWLSSASSAW
jgi:hypothetical protein